MRQCHPNQNLLAHVAYGQSLAMQSSESRELWGLCRSTVGTDWNLIQDCTHLAQQLLIHGTFISKRHDKDG